MKKILAASVVTLAIFSATVQPAFAAENIFQKIGDSLQSRFTRIYLMLPGEKSGQSVLNEATTAMQNVKTSVVDATITADMMEAGKSQANAKFTVSGPVKIDNAYDPKSYKQDLNFAAEVAMQGTTLKGNADLKIDGESLYFKLNEIPALPYFNLAELKGKWLKTENKAAEKESSMTAEKQEKAKAAFMKLVKASQIGSAKKETRDGHKVFVVSVTTPKAALKDYILEVRDTTTADIEMGDTLLTQLDSALDKVGDLNSTIYVDAGSFYVREYDLPLSFKPDTTEEETSMAKSAANPLASLGKIDEVKLVITVKMDKFNEKIDFVTPSDAQDAKEAFQKAMMKGSPYGSSMTLPTSTQPESDLMMKYKTPVVPSTTTKFNADQYKTQLTPEQYAKLKELGY
jgi:hypothetical protein